MAECEYIDTCPFPGGELPEKGSNVEELKDEYCRSNSLHCARLMVSMALGDQHIPEDLYPDEKQRAYQLIATSG
jgi:hypothetical protein